MGEPERVAIARHTPSAPTDVAYPDSAPNALDVELGQVACGSKLGIIDSMRRACRYVCPALLAFAVVFVGLYVWSTYDPVREKFDKIEPGWTRADVEGFMGQWSTEAMSNEGVILFYRGIDGTGNVILDPATDIVIRRQWYLTETDPIWLRFWHRLTTAQGL